MVDIELGSIECPPSDGEPGGPSAAIFMSSPPTSPRATARKSSVSGANGRRQRAVPRAGQQVVPGECRIGRRLIAKVRGGLGQRRRMCRFLSGAGEWLHRTQHHPVLPPSRGRDGLPPAGAASCCGRCADAPPRANRVHSDETFGSTPTSLLAEPSALRTTPRRRSLREYGGSPDKTASSSSGGVHSR